MKYKLIHQKRYQKTLDFLLEVVPPPATILDLGVRNPFSEILENNGYKVFNTSGEDLDLNFNFINDYKVDAITAFEILEHLVAPFPLLNSINCNQIVTTIPLRLWFSKAYRNKQDKRDQHFHEFEDWQFDWLLEKAGYKIIQSKKWTSPIRKIGFRPILRFFTPRYYAVYAKK
ncbi:MAG: methyltransferase [Lutibacter sp.]